MDFSYYDRVVAPIIVASPELELLYVNPIAKRQFPLLASSAGLFSRYKKEELEQISRSMRKGQPCLLSYDEDLNFFLLFDPGFSGDGELDRVHIYVVSHAKEPYDVFPVMTDGELLHYMQREIADPLGLMLRQMQLVESFARESKPEKVVASVKAIRDRMMKMTIFCARMDHSSGSLPHARTVIDAVRVLNICNEAFPMIKCKGTEHCYVAVEREALMLIISDVLASLAFRQDKSKISVSISLEEGSVLIQFRSGPLTIPINVPCDEDFDGIDLGMFSVRHRVERNDGQVLIRHRAHGAVTVTLKFPAVERMIFDGMVRDSQSAGFSETEACILEYLRLISAKNQGL